jgi:hypothetical protein
MRSDTQEMRWGERFGVCRIGGEGRQRSGVEDGLDSDKQSVQFLVGNALTPENRT